jgi:hypothetical protein
MECCWVTECCWATDTCSATKTGGSVKTAGHFFRSLPTSEALRLQMPTERSTKRYIPRREATMLKQVNCEMGVIFDEIEIEEVIAPRL